MSTKAHRGRRLLTPPPARVPWLAWGAILQVLGLGGVAVVMWRNIRQHGIAGHITAEMVALAWHSELHTRFGSFLLSAPVILAAGVLKNPDLMGPLGAGIRGQTLFASLLAGVGGYLSVRFLVRWLRTRPRTPFAVYCLALGLGSIMYLELLT